MMSHVNGCIFNLQCLAWNIYEWNFDVEAVYPIMQEGTSKGGRKRGDAGATESKAKKAKCFQSGTVAEGTEGGRSLKQQTADKARGRENKPLPALQKHASRGNGKRELRPSTHLNNYVLPPKQI